MNLYPFETNRPIDVICMGRVAVDLYAEQIGLALEDAQTFRKYLGGCAGNIAVGTAKLGLHSSIFSCVGEDAMGVFLKKELQKENVDISLLTETPNHLTGLVLLGVNPPNRFPLIFYRENCADMQLKKESCLSTIFKKSKSLLVTGTCLSTPEMLETTLHAIHLAKDNGLAVIFDIDFRPVLWKLTTLGNGESRYISNDVVSKTYQKVLNEMDLIIGTEEEFMIASGTHSTDEALSKFVNLLSATLVLKKGKDGCEIHARHLDTPIKSKPFPVTILNVLGAGDAFMSGFLSGWLRKQPLAQCAEYANACGALVVTRHGCAPAMPRTEEMLAFIREYQPEPA